MKDFFKKNVFGICMSAAMGGLTFLLYLIGKGEGQIEMATEITDILTETLEATSQESTE